MRAPVLIAVGVLVATVALHLRDPHESTWVPWVFPFWGPGCGGLRAVHDLSNLQLAAAASSNLLFVASIPFLVAGWLWWMWRAWHGRPASPPAHVALALGWLVLFLMVAFAVLRNLPAGAWLAP